MSEGENSASPPASMIPRTTFSPRSTVRPVTPPSPPRRRTCARCRASSPTRARPCPPTAWSPPLLTSRWARPGPSCQSDDFDGLVKWCRLVGDSAATRGPGGAAQASATSAVVVRGRAPANRLRDRRVDVVRRRAAQRRRATVPFLGDGERNARRLDDLAADPAEAGEASQARRRRPRPGRSAPCPCPACRGPR